MRRNTKMVQLLWLVRDRVLGFLREERAQDTFEYILIIGGISVAVIAAVVLVAPSLMDQVVYGVCKAVETIVPDVSCTAPA
jgi:Flp pilus assembly pilin Flp